MEQIIFDSSWLLRKTTFLEELSETLIFLRVVYLFYHSNYSHPSFEVGYYICFHHRKSSTHLFFKGYYIYFHGRSCSHPLFEQFFQKVFISKKKLVSVMCSFRGTIIFLSTVLHIFLTLKLQSSTVANALSFSVFQNTSHREINFLSKQQYFQDRIDYIEMRAATWSSCAAFSPKDFFQNT